jgi:hypothetical protein
MKLLLDRGARLELDFTDLPGRLIVSYDHEFYLNYLRIEFVPDMGDDEADSLLLIEQEI